MEPDKISLLLKDNPDLASAFQGAGAGDTVTLKLTFQIDEVSVDMVVGSVTDTEDISVKDSEDDSDAEDANESDEGEASSDVGSQNVVAVMSPGYKQK